MEERFFGRGRERHMFGCELGQGFLDFAPCMFYITICCWEDSFSVSFNITRLWVMYKVFDTVGGICQQEIKDAGGFIGSELRTIPLFFQSPDTKGLKSFDLRET
ncbi:hypothetical protein CAPTEDRAFT_202380 [Capitella teleta]|uniref:Uncharacterized protein n=1 Tax=Capitella teleta TaxID=283909 RepID=R7TC31_CAPTE|nr:hypothetical protein CAPTEDRAFT_202380 [Capitella teleta]|eukprot:ELT91264.1 hypothetical protein CAPTEDRAFT_202380 [Capitella teleta]